jgi:predicted lipoprotein with Yx(FWY)xxD motif
MRRSFLLTALTVALVAFFSVAAVAMDHAVKLTEKSGVGKFFTDAKGMTLYIFKKDAPGKSACSGPCAERWPIYFRESVAAPEGVKAEDFGTIARDDGKKQTTYKGWPLYYFADDKNPGDTNGQGKMDAWYVADPSKIGM